MFPNIEILGGAADNVPGATQSLEHEQIIEANDIKIRCLHTPCHTRGHMLYLFEPTEGVNEGMEHVADKVAQGYQVTR